MPGNFSMWTFVLVENHCDFTGMKTQKYPDMGINAWLKTLNINDLLISDILCVGLTCT